MNYKVHKKHLNIISKEVKEKISDPKLRKIEKKANFLRTIELLVIILCIVSVCPFGITWAYTENDLFLILMGVALVTSIVFGIVFYFTKFMKKPVFEEIIKMDYFDLYKRCLDYYINESKEDDLKDLKLNKMEQNFNITKYVKEYSTVGGWLKHYDYINSGLQANYLFFEYRDQKFILQSNTVIKIFTTQGNFQWQHNMSNAVSGWKPTAYRGSGKKSVRYISTNTLVLQNSKFGKEYNGIIIVPGKVKKGFFTAESMAFNKKYFVNVKDDDLKGPKFLRPKMVELLAKKSKPKKELIEIAVNDNIYVARKHVAYNDKTSPIASFNHKAILRSRSIYKSVSKKIFDDIAMMVTTFDYIRGIY